MCARHRIVELEIDETLDRIGVGHDHAHGRADADFLFASLGKPSLAIRFHRVFIVVERFEPQQAVDADAAQLHETAVFDYRGDDAVESLPEALAQVTAFQEAVDVAIGFVGPLLESR